MANATCTTVQERLSAYLDDRLPSAELTEVRGHLGDCADCRAEREALETTDALVEAALGDHPFGDAFVESILTQLPAEMPRRAQPARRSAHPAGFGVAALAAGLLLALGLGFGMERQPAPQPTVTAEAPVVGEAGAGLLIVTKDGSSVELAPGSQVRAGDRLLAVASPPARVTLNDGTKIDLHADTEVRLERERGGLTVVMAGAEGKVFCDVAKRREAFRVRSRGLEVLVLGTQFLVDQRHRSSAVTVVEGKVMVSSAKDRRTLTADLRAEASTEGDGQLAIDEVASRRHGLWVPRLAEQQQAMDRAAAKAAEPAPSAPEPAKPEPTRPAPPAAPDMDVPMAPPTLEKNKN